MALQKNHKKIFHKPLDKRRERCIIKSKVRQGQTCERARIISTGKSNEDEGLGNKRKKRGYCIEGATEDEKIGYPQKWTRQKQGVHKSGQGKSKRSQRWTNNKKQVSAKADKQQKKCVHKSGHGKARCPQKRTGQKQASTKADRAKASVSTKVDTAK